MTACRLRKIFVDERLGLQPVAGPQHSQAAMIMGNSERAWTTHYDLNANMRGCQAAADASGEWRKAMLASGLRKKAALLEQDMIDLECMDSD